LEELAEAGLVLGGHPGEFGDQGKEADDPGEGLSRAETRGKERGFGCREYFAVQFPAHSADYKRFTITE
jgi:hypothetical protein